MTCAASSPKPLPALAAEIEMASKRAELRDRTGWPMETLRYELAFQQADGQFSFGPGRCGHTARGSGFCADS